MDELKQKLINLINKQSPKIPSMGFSDANYHFSQAETLSINSKTVDEANRPADQDILESIEAAYFSTKEDFDICRFELSKLPDFLECDQIQKDFKNLKQQHQVVSKKVLQMILEQQTACNEEFLKILEICNELKETLQLCRTSRNDLNIAERQFSVSLGILANYRKRRLAQNLLDDLNVIKNLQCYEERVQFLLNDGDYVGAIEELKRCQKVAAKYKHFACVAALTNKLQETLESTDNQLEAILSQLCFHFEADRYEKLQLAYDLLEKSQILMIDSLHLHYTTAIHETAFNTVSSYTKDSDLGVNNGKNLYKICCQSVKKDSLIPCLIQLCKSLFKIIMSYRQLYKYHNNVESEEVSPKGNIEGNMNRQYIRQKLDHSLSKIWDDVQWKVCHLLSNSDLATYKFDEFVQVLGIVYRLIQVGDEFCDSKSEELQVSIRTQSIKYFRNYHYQRLEELKIFLENESWEVCPVKATFDILQLQEFKSLRNDLKNYKKQHFQSSQIYSSSSPDCGSSNHSQDGSSIISGNYFIRYAEQGTPFDSRLDETLIEEDIMVNVGDSASGYFSEDSEEECEELRRDYVEEYTDESTHKRRDKHGKHYSKAPILANTTLKVLRQIGKYLQMSRLLKPIAYNIITSMNQLFEYYLYTVHSYFTSDLIVSSSSLYTKDLNATLNRISEDLFNPKDTEGSEDVGTRIEKPKLSIAVDMTNDVMLHGLAERMVAVESVVFLGKQFAFLEAYVEGLVPQANRIMLQQFYAQTIASTVDLRRVVYMAVAAQAFDLRQILNTMSKINWEVKEVMSQHNKYVDDISRATQIFAMRLEQIAANIPIPDAVRKVLWENISHIITHTLVQGFSEAKKCSNGGRALMQLDFTQFLTIFEKMSNLRPVPHREYVENYVKAFYLPEIELEKWIKEHTEYSSKHLFGLVSCACQNNRKTKQRLLQIIEEIEKGTNLDR